ncbi:hypothetical protein Syun_007296 [Stephania yunnanensis]|uniref:Uncharacterized protein n=1 Tax=Stephania yunnanensis TaxID=152371 RepID=A0AAP0KZ94_9MAGN
MLQYIRNQGVRRGFGSTFFLPTKEQCTQLGASNRLGSSGVDQRPAASTSDQGDAEGGGAMQDDQRPGRCRGRRHDAEGGGAMRTTKRVGEMREEEARCRTRTMNRAMTGEMQDDQGDEHGGDARTREEEDEGRGRPSTTTTKWRRDDDDEVEARRRRRSGGGFSQTVGWSGTRRADEVSVSLKNMGKKWE